MKTIEWYVWKPSRGQVGFGFGVDIACCRYSVPEEFGIGFRQCTRKRKVIIQGYGFCTQHSKKVNKGLSGKKVDATE